MTENNQKSIAKDSPYRSLFKAVSWRFIASGATFIISFIIFRQVTEKTYAEVLETATIITTIEMFAKLVLYYLHERMWTNIVWGKYWRRQAIKRKIRKRQKEKNKISN